MKNIVLFLLLLISVAIAQELTIVPQPGLVYSKTFQIPTTGIAHDSCRIVENTYDGSCTYISKCYIILPENCNDVSCAIKRECIEINGSLSNPELVTVIYETSSQDIGKKYGTAAFLAKSEMTYNWTTAKWTEKISLVGNQLGDTIEIPGITLPPPPSDPISQLFGAVIQGLKSILCSLFGVWCS